MQCIATTDNPHLPTESAGTARPRRLVSPTRSLNPLGQATEPMAAPLHLVTLLDLTVSPAHFARYRTLCQQLAATGQVALLCGADEATTLAFGAKIAAETTPDATPFCHNPWEFMQLNALEPHAEAFDLCFAACHVLFAGEVYGGESPLMA